MATIKGEELVRLARHRTVYDVALAFYGVLAALALDGPLKALAESIVARPTGQGLDDWTARLLTVALLVLAAVWLYALVASIELNDTSSKSPYWRALVQFWTGVVMVVILMTLGNAVKRGTASFLSVSVIYVVWGLFFSLISQLTRKASVADGSRESRIAKWNIVESLIILVILGGLVYWARNVPAHGVQPFVLALFWLLIVIATTVSDYIIFDDYYAT